MNILARTGLALGLCGLLGAAPHPDNVSQTAATGEFRIETDQTNSNLNTGDFTMPDHVRFFRPGTDVTGDRAHGNFKSGVVTVEGHVVLHDNGQASEAQSAGAPAGGGPATLTCDKLEIDSKRKIYVATGSVHFVQGTRTATADRGTLDQGSHALDLSGDVHLADGDEALSAQVVHYNTLTKDVNTSGNTVMRQPAAAMPGTASTLPTPRPQATRVH